MTAPNTEQELLNQIDALLAINAKGNATPRIPGLAVELLTRSAEALRRRSSDEQAEVVGWQWQQCKSLQPGVWPEQWNNIELRPGEDRTQYWRDLAARIPDEVRVRPLYASPPAVAAGGVTDLREVSAPELVNEIWECLFNETKDAVPDCVTDELLNAVGARLLDGYTISRKSR